MTPTCKNRLRQSWDILAVLMKGFDPVCVLNAVISRSVRQQWRSCCESDESDAGEEGDILVQHERYF